MLHDELIDQQVRGESCGRLSEYLDEMLRPHDSGNRR